MKEIKYTILYCVCENYCHSILFRIQILIIKAFISIVSLHPGLKFLQPHTGTEGAAVAIHN
jgi:hypothetical protein